MGQEKEKVLLSRRLVTIDTEIPFTKEISFFEMGSPQWADLKEFYRDKNFASLLREMEDQVKEPVRLVEVHDLLYQKIEDLEALNELVKMLSTCSQICVDTETTALHPMEARLVGVGLGIEKGKAWYVPLNGKIAREVVIATLKPLFENPSIGFYGHHVKYDFHVLLNEGITIAYLCFDTMLASYLLNSHSRQHSLDHLSLELFGKVKISIQSLIGKGKNQLGMQDVPIDQVCAYCCEDVDYTMRLKDLFEPQLIERGLTSLLNDVELPLLPLLAKMERKGIFVDADYLSHLGLEVGREIQVLAEEIYAMADETFNLNSPKQLSLVLFEKLGIRPPKKTTTGHSTSADVLESLKHQYPIAAKILEYRSLEKLRSTYIEALPKQINPQTGRIHCTFNQFVTATGRLSCQDPNLQNIPVRTEVGRKIREAFRPQFEEWSYLAADYSQIELRLLAHLSEDETLMKAFQSQEDIHTFTASQIFNLPLEEVTREQRYQAKTVNFGIMYGQQAFGLSQELGIDPKTAARFIQLYFERYHKVKEFIEECKAKARETGKAVTLLGRERFIPEIKSTNGMIRTMAERLAVNTPIQGTQADLIKMAMIEIDKEMVKKNMRAFCILQIHDELLFEVPVEEIEEMKTIVHDAMVHVIQLKVPLIVDIHIGKNWKEC